MGEEDILEAPQGYDFEYDNHQYDNEDYNAVYEIRLYKNEYDNNALQYDDTFSRDNAPQYYNPDDYSRNQPSYYQKLDDSAGYINSQSTNPQHYGQP